MAHAFGSRALSGPAGTDALRASSALQLSKRGVQHRQVVVRGGGLREARPDGRLCALSSDGPRHRRATPCTFIVRDDAPSSKIRVFAASGNAPTIAGPELEEVAALRPVVVIDNYDSFTYNLCQYLGDLGCPYVVHRNDEITVDELRRGNPSGILISPGPGTPDDSGISLEVVRQLGPEVPLFGVCMGLQCMGQAFGGNIVRAPGGVMHGKTSEVFHNQAEGDGLMGGLPNPFTACRYHSLVIERSSFPEGELEVTAWTADGLVMGVRHQRHRHIEGVQFHPESIITQNGKRIVANFVRSLVAREPALRQNGRAGALS